MTRRALFVVLAIGLLAPAVSPGAAAAQAASDPTPPTVVVTRPAPGVVSGRVTLDVMAADDVGVAAVEYLLDGR
jgi:hypothetical protein